MNRGRFQAQGGIEKSSNWATEEIIYKENGHWHIDNVVAQLTPAEFRERSGAIDRARIFVDNAPSHGVFSFLRKTFRNSPQHRSIRFDVDIFEGAAFVTKI